MGAAGSGWAWDWHEGAARAKAILLEELHFLKQLENRRGHSIDSMAMIGVHVGELLRLEAI